MLKFQTPDICLTDESGMDQRFLDGDRIIVRMQSGANNQKML